MIQSILSACIAVAVVIGVEVLGPGMSALALSQAVFTSVNKGLGSMLPAAAANGAKVTFTQAMKQTVNQGMRQSARQAAKAMRVSKILPKPYGFTMKKWDAFNPEAVSGTKLYSTAWDKVS
jgi:hypothetical protein